MKALATLCSELMTAGVIGTGVVRESLTAWVMTVSGRPVALAQVAAQADSWVCGPGVGLVK